MTTKRLCVFLLLTALFTLCLAFTTAYAGETVLFDKGFKNVYANDNLEKNNNGNLSGNTGYQNGTIWATEWGGKGWYSDGEEGLLIHPAIGSEYADEKAAYHKLPAAKLPEDTEIEITYDFNTFDKPETTQGQVWFRLGVTGKSSVLFMLGINPVDGYVFDFASLTSGYPMEFKKFDRTSGKIAFDYNKNYTVKIILRPYQDTYKFIAEVLEEGNRIGMGIVEDYSGFAKGAFMQLNNLHINAVARGTITEQENIMSLNHVTVKAVYEDKKLDASYIPEDKSENVHLDSDIYVDFPMAVEEVSTDDVSVSGGAFVEDVYLSEEGKRVNVVLGGLKADTTYDVSLKNVIASGAAKAFDYGWSFTTGGAVSISNPSLLEGGYNENLNTVDLGTLVPVSDESYLSGENWGYIGTNPANEFFIEDDYLYVRASQRSVNDWSDYRLSKKINPVSDGNSMIFKTTIRHCDISKHDANWTRGSSLRLADSDDKTNNITLYRSIYTGVFALGHNSSIGTGADSGDEQEIEGLVKNTDADIEVILTPEEDYYRVYFTISQKGNVVAELTRTLTKEQAEGLDSIQLWSATMKTSQLHYAYGVKDIRVSTGIYSLTEGTNKFYFDFANNDPSTPASFEVLIVEHKSETGEGFGRINKVTVKKFEDITEESATMECEFEFTDADAVVDVYFVSSTDSMNLLCEKVSF